MNCTKELVVIIYLLILILITLLLFFRDFLYSLLSFISLRLEGREPDFQVLNSLRDDLIHERKKKIASLEMILSTWEKGESISTHLDYFRDLISQLKIILKDQRENLLMISSDPFLWVRLKSQVMKIERGLQKIEKDKQKIKEIKKRLSIFSDEIEEILEDGTQKFTFSLNEVIRESVKIVRTEKDRVLKEKEIKIEERYEDIGERFRLPYKNYRDWQKLIANLIRNGVEAVEQKPKANSPSPLATGYSLLAKVVRIEVRGVREDVTVVVEDNGIGMDEKTKETFYKRGFTQGKETGLGLGITEETIEFVNKYGSWNIESKINEGTRIEIKIEKEKARKQDLRVEDRSALVIKLKSRRVMFALAGVLVVAICLGLYFQFNKYARFWEDWNPAIAEARGNMLIVKNKSNRVLWDTLLPGIVLDTSHVNLSDLNGDGKAEVLVLINYTEISTGKLVCFNYRKEKLWEFSCGEYGVYETGKELNSRYFSPTFMKVEDINGDGGKEIIVNSKHNPWFPDQLVILDRNGIKKAEYWHPGAINCLYCTDFDGDGKKEIILGGTNNRMGWCAIVSVLASDRVSGQAMPYTARKEIEKAKEKWYVIFPNIKKRLPDQSHWESYITGVDDIGIYSKDDKIIANLGDGRAYHLSLDFGFNYVYPAPGYFERWAQVNAFPYKLTAEDSANWKNIEVWREGVRIR
ncbi:MAG: ATP-binding protein [candidate division Zixibacteria bacterium]|nr:ATP-binding protein [candidate division Zixibacteria bacterium]